MGTIPGILLGMIMGMNRTVRLMLDATMPAIYVLPKIAIFPIMMLIFLNPLGEGPRSLTGHALAEGVPMVEKETTETQRTPR